MYAVRTCVIGGEKHPPCVSVRRGFDVMRKLFCNYTGRAGRGREERDGLIRRKTFSFFIFDAPVSECQNKQERARRKAGRRHRTKIILR